MFDRKKEEKWEGKNRIWVSEEKSEEE